MIDIHSHLLYGIDDGPSKLEESISMIVQAEKLGIKGIICTVHLHEEMYNLDLVEERFEEVVYKAREYDLKLRIGYEVFISSSTPDSVRKKSFFTLNNSNYWLGEFPFSSFPLYCYETIDMLLFNKIIPIISHPERCRFFHSYVEIFESFLQRGCLVQVDTASIMGIYGADVKSFVKKLIKANKVNFVASNAHYERDYSDWYMKAYNKVLEWAGEEYTDMVFRKNPGKILEGA